MAANSKKIKEERLRLETELSAKLDFTIGICQQAAKEFKAALLKLQENCSHEEEDRELDGTCAICKKKL